MLEYEDGTPANVPQMAKDVSVFLEWCSSMLCIYGSVVFYRTCALHNIAACAEAGFSTHLIIMSSWKEADSLACFRQILGGTSASCWVTRFAPRLAFLLSPLLTTTVSCLVSGDLVVWHTDL